MDLYWTKITVAILFGFLRLFFGLLPIKLYSYLKIWVQGEKGFTVDPKRKQNVDCALTLVQSFGGGVLLATCFLHLMPDVYFAVHELEEHYDIERSYPFSQLLICTGFFLIYFIEEFCQYMITKDPKCPRLEKCEAIKSVSSSVSSISSAVNKVSPVQEKKIAFDEKSVDSGLDKSNDEINIPMPTSERELIIELEKEPKQILRCILITMALSFHAIFEGIAIGLQHSVTNIWYIFVAISIHSVTILFCVGVELLFSHKRKLVIFYFVFALSITSPIGILIGLGVTKHAGDEDYGTAVASALLEALSAGTLLYITFFEVLTREKERRVFRLKRGLCIIGGFAIMALLQIVE